MQTLLIATTQMTDKHLVPACTMISDNRRPISKLFAAAEDAALREEIEKEPEPAHCNNALCALLDAKELRANEQGALP